MQRHRLLAAAIVLAVAVGAIAATAHRETAETTERAPIIYGPSSSVGGGTARSYVEFDTAGAPTSVGVELTAAALTKLAPRMNLTSRCFDRDGNGTLTHGECIGDYQASLALPDEANARGIPVRWISLNWNPEGHMKPAPPVWGASHFDFHFYIVPPEVIQAIRPGGCAEIIDCDDFKTAQVPLPAAHQPPGHLDVGAAVAAMGNHLIDRHDPELADPSRGFSRTFIYGAYGGRLIFLEPMVSLKYLSSKPAECTALRTPASVEIPGYYPTRYCVRFDAPTSNYRVSLEGLVRRPLALGGVGGAE